MADQNVTELTENTSPALVDLIYTVDDPSGAPLDRKVTLQNVMELAPHYVDRGDPSDWDFEETDLTTDETWNELDCSSVVPAGAVAIIFCGYISDDAAGSYLLFRKNGNTNSYNKGSVTAAVANQGFDFQVIVGCDADRKVQYYGKNVTFTAIKICIAGWFIDTVN